MKRYYRFLMLMAFILGTLAFGFPRNVDASFILVLDDTATGGIDVIIADDQNSGFGTFMGLSTIKDPRSNITGLIAYDSTEEYDHDSNPATPEIPYGPVGAFSIQISTAYSKPVVGSSQFALIDITNQSLTSAGGGNLDIWVTDTDFLLAGQTTVPVILLNGIGGNTPGTVTSRGFLDTNNGEGVISGVGVYSTPPIVSTGSGFGGSSTVNIGTLSNAPFSLTEYITVNHPGVGLTTFDKSLSAKPIPEPGTLLLLGSGLVGLAGYAKLRLKRRRS